MRLSTAAEEQLRTLVRVFLEENKNVNLSAFRTEESCWIGNVLDSLSFLNIASEVSPNPLPPSPDGGRGTEGEGGIASTNILDLGTGGGFPLLPLALCIPDGTFTGIDATEKKIYAIERMCKNMHINNVELRVGRAEELGRDAGLREQFDVVTARALADLPVLLEYAAPFARVGGSIVCWKSMRIEEELRSSLLARAEFSCHLKLQHPYSLPAPYGERQLVVFEKTAALSEKYPRSIGAAAKKPIL